MTCACKSPDAYECWAIRYDLPPDFMGEEVEMDGGPCQCACHEPDPFDDDEDWL